MRLLVHLRFHSGLCNKGDRTTACFTLSMAAILLPIRRFGERLLADEPYLRLADVDSSAAGLWDRTRLAIWHIEHPTHPNTHVHPVGVAGELHAQERLNTNNSNWNGFGGLTDFTQEQTAEGKLRFALIHTGDIYEIVKEDPEKHPLPSFCFKFAMPFA